MAWITGKVQLYETDQPKKLTVGTPFDTSKLTKVYSSKEKKMRYLINDDDLEDWVKILKDYNKTKDSCDINYVIEEMESHYSQHYEHKEAEIPKPLPIKSKFSLFLADFKARMNS